MKRTPQQLIEFEKKLKRLADEERMKGESTRWSVLHDNPKNPQ